MRKLIPMIALAFAAGCVEDAEMRQTSLEATDNVGGAGGQGGSDGGDTGAGGAPDPTTDPNAQDTDGAGGDEADADDDDANSDANGGDTGAGGAPDPTTDPNAQDDDGIPPEEPAPGPGLHILALNIESPFDVAAMDFSYGYCSDVERGQDCLAWSPEPVAHVLWENQLTYGEFADQGIVVQETGWLRFNSSYYLDGSDVDGDDIVGRADRWLAEDGNPTSILNGTVTVWLDNQLIEANVYLVEMDEGSSAALNIAELVAAL